MKRRKFLDHAAAGIAGTTVATILPSTLLAQQNEKRITHYVLFWLKEELGEQDVVKFADFFEELRKIPTIRSLEYGRPAKTNIRDVVDNSFTYNLLVRFDKMEDINVYEKHPIHLAAIEKFKHNWGKVVVHDSVLS